MPLPLSYNKLLIMNDDTQLARWLAGELKEEELQELQNSPQYATLLRIKENFTRLQSPQFNADGMLEEIIAAQKNTAPKAIPLYRRAWFQAAAAIVILLGAGMFFTMPEEFKSPNGETLAFNLPDKSEVILNDGSAASYRSLNWDSNREIELKGEAYFKVAKGKTFTVTTPGGNVTVMGTQFNVRSRDGRFEVICYEGKVRVEHKKREFILTPNQGITFAGDTDSGVKEIPVQEPQWLHDEIVFSKETLTGVIAELERQYNINIETDYQSKQLFSGSLPANDMGAALKVISKTFHLDVTKRDETVILKPLNAKP